MSRKHLHVVDSSSFELNIPEAELELMEEMISAYEVRRLGSRNHKQKSVSSDTAVIRSFLTFIQKAPWNATTDDFDAWCYQIGREQKVATNSQRKYQSAVQGFYRYIVDNVKFQAAVLDRYNLRIIQLVTEENKIPHVHERQRTNERPAFTHQDFESFIGAIDVQIVEAYKFHSKEFLALQRDKVMFYSMYVMALRNSECCDLNLSSFRSNPNLPEFGDYGFASVWGKGSKGSGPKQRAVAIDHADLPPLLDWYVNDIRPQYLQKPHCDPNEEAFFLTERGSRMKSGSLNYRFKKILGYAGLSEKGFVPHCLRHTFTTHASSAGMSLEYSKIKLGHEYAATTQTYTHCGDEFVNREAVRYAQSIINRLSDDE